MIDFDERDGERLGKAFGKGDTHHEGAEKSRPACEGHSVDLRRGYPSVAYGRIHHWDDVLLMGTGSQFGHYTTILLMHLLRGNDIGQDTVAPQDGCGGVVARRFDGEYYGCIHFYCFSSTVAVSFCCKGCPFCRSILCFATTRKRLCPLVYLLFIVAM